MSCAGSCPPSVDPAREEGRLPPSIHPSRITIVTIVHIPSRQPISFVAQNRLRKSSWQRSGARSVRHINLTPANPPPVIEKGSAGRSRAKLRPSPRQEGRKREKTRLIGAGCNCTRDVGLTSASLHLLSTQLISSGLQRKSALSLCDMHTGSDCSRQAGKCMSNLLGFLEPRCAAFADGVAGLLHGCNLECASSHCQVHLQ
ncbi:hypothetical protein LZ30DRAFT_105134 [Colletotrichum cereale]|nr:hypothetical protein LZ30DRAFT_105134 [Colletotrichum cereale]